MWGALELTVISGILSIGRLISVMQCTERHDEPRSVYPRSILSGKAMEASAHPFTGQYNGNINSAL